MVRQQTDIVRNFLLDALESGALSSGMKLPTERELAAQFSVSRAAVRQALTVLEVEGRVLRHVGRGTFVTGGSIEEQIERPYRRFDTSPAMLLEARDLIEVKIVENVVLNATERDLELIQLTANQADSSKDALAFERADAVFHRQIALATHNDLIVAAFDVINDARSNPEWTKLKLRKNRSAPLRRDDVIAEHQRICNALFDRDASEAAAAMHAHLQMVRKNLLGR